MNFKRQKPQRYFAFAQSPPRRSAKSAKFYCL